MKGYTGWGGDDPFTPYIWEFIKWCFFIFISIILINFTVNIINFFIILFNNEDEITWDYKINITDKDYLTWEYGGEYFSENWEWVDDEPEHYSTKIIIDYSIEVNIEEDGTLSISNDDLSCGYVNYSHYGWFGFTSSDDYTSELIQEASGEGFKVSLDTNITTIFLANDGGHIGPSPKFETDYFYWDGSLSYQSEEIVQGTEFNIEL